MREGALFFRTTPPILPTPPFLLEKSEPTFLSELRKLNPQL